MIPVVPAPRKTQRAGVVKGKMVKKPRSGPPKKLPSSKVTAKRAAAVTENDSGVENFDIDGFTDLDDSESGAEHRPPKPTPARQRK